MRKGVIEISNRVAVKSHAKKMTFEQRAEGNGEEHSRQAEETANTEALRWECAWHIQEIAKKSKVAGLGN